MGTWGYMPGDDDGTHDRISDLEHSAIWPWVKEMFSEGIDASDRHASAWQYSRVGVVVKLVSREFIVPRSIALQCVEDLKACAADEEWIKTWRSPKTARKVIAEIQSMFQAVIDQDEPRFKKSRGKARQRFALYGMKDQLAVSQRKIRFWSTLARKERDQSRSRRRRRRKASAK
jgi:hypothetical protein